MPALPSRASFVSETATEFLTSADLNGDGTADALVLDKTTGNARVGYGGANGTLVWSSPMLTGVENVSGCASGRFLFAGRDALAVTAVSQNRINVLDLSATNAAGTPTVFSPAGIGPHSLAGLPAPTGGSPPYHYLLAASSLNSAPGEQLDLIHVVSGTPSPSGHFNETGSFERPNAFQLAAGAPTLCAAIVRGSTNDTLHLWQFTNSPGVFLSLSNLPPGSDYTFGTFNNESLPRFIFWQAGASNLSLVPLVQTNGGLAFGAAQTVALAGAVQGVFVLQTGADGSALINFGDGIQGLRLPGGTPALSTVYRSGTGATGNVFTGIAPLAGDQFALLDASPGSAASVHAQVMRFDGTSFTQRSASFLPALSSRTTRADVWLFQFEPFVNREPGFIASLNSPDWSDGISGLPGAVSVVRESDGGFTSGLSGLNTNNAGAPPTGSAFGLANQVNPAISLFSYSGPRAAEPISVTINPTPGSYANPVTISFSKVGAGGVLYRAGAADAWHLYTVIFTLTNDATIQFYGTNTAGTRSQLQFASYSLGGSGGSAPALDLNPGDTNPPPVVNTNILLLSQNGTVFYGRRGIHQNGVVSTIWAINLDGSGETYITTGTRPRVSKDGRYLAFLRDGSPLLTQGNAWVRDLTTGQESMLFTNGNYTIGYDWDRTGTNLVFDWSCWLWRIGLGGAPATQLPLPTDCYDDAPVVNPVDGRLAFHNLGPTASLEGIYVTSSNLTTKQLLPLGVAGASWPAWSPDGQRLVFVDGNTPTTAFTADGGKNLWVVDGDGMDLNQISGLTGTDGFPHGAIYSPDGDALVTAGTIFGTNGLWVIPLTPDGDDCDGPPFRLPTSPGDPIDFAGSIVVAPPPPIVVTRPGLFIRHDPGVVVVYWSFNFAGYTLEYTTDLSPTATWIAIPGPYSISGPWYEHREPDGSLAQRRFFRLSHTGAVPLAPQLRIRLETNNAVVSWPTNSGSFTLESKSDLSPAVSWTTMPGPYPASGGNYEVRSPATQRRFYRLHSL